MRKKIAKYLLIVLLTAMLCPFSLAEGMDYIIPPPLTKWPSDPGPKPERPIYPAIQAWVTALEETTSWKYSDWVQPSWLEDLFVVFQDGENNLLLWFVKAEDGAWQLKMSRENALPKTELKFTLKDSARTSDFHDDTPLGISFFSGYCWSIIEHAMEDYACCWQKQEDGVWRLVLYNRWHYQPGQDRNKQSAPRSYIVVDDESLTYYDERTFEDEAKGIVVPIHTDTNLETIIVDHIPITPEEAQKML